MDQGNNNQQIARELGVERETVQQWRSQWLAEVPRLTAAEVSGVSDSELQAMIEEVLLDEARLGARHEFHCHTSYSNHRYGDVLISSFRISD